MRDLILASGLAAGMLAAIRRPWLGALLWVLVGVLNPHRMGYLVSGLPVAAAVAVAIAFGMLVSRPPFRVPLSAAPVALLAMLSVWICLSYQMSPAIEANHAMWARVMKIYLMVFVVLGLLVTRAQVEALVWVLVLSLGFYGLKGGRFTLATGGAYKVWGPEGSFIEGNNELALALVMAIPLMLYLRSVSSGKWLRRGLLAAVLLCGLSALGSHSRGALLAICAMSGFLWLRSSNKLGYGILLAAAGVAVLMLMPSAWTERMSTISTYDQDASAM
ncbi:MAG: putative O-glycosylation ligase, exosortase A system-associated, partial [Zoogloea sp.]|nr:putative O-glycosylation ligase, exosortase A system-associated [Zoogloea sp.]